MHFDSNSHRKLFCYAKIIQFCLRPNSWIVCIHCSFKLPICAIWTTLISAACTLTQWQGQRLVIEFKSVFTRQPINLFLFRRILPFDLLGIFEVMIIIFYILCSVQYWCSALIASLKFHWCFVIRDFYCVKWNTCANKVVFLLRCRQMI